MIISAPVEVEKCFSQLVEAGHAVVFVLADSRFLAILIDNDVRLFRFDETGLTRVR
jgi:hypothetical protein